MTNTNIVIHRGDSCSFDVAVYAPPYIREWYELVEDDALYFGLMDPHQPFEDALIRKRYDKDDVNPVNNTVQIQIDPQDTLDLFPGKYYYSVKVKMDHTNLDGSKDERVITIINNSKFIICD